MNHTIEFCTSKLDLVPNFTITWQFWLFWPNFPKKDIPVRKTQRLQTQRYFNVSSPSNHRDNYHVDSSWRKFWSNVMYVKRFMKKFLLLQLIPSFSSCNLNCRCLFQNKTYVLIMLKAFMLNNLKSPYAVPIWENTYQKNLWIWTLFKVLVSVF